MANKPQIGEGDPLILELERIVGDDYPIELISLILREKNKSYVAGFNKFPDKFLDEIDKKFPDRMMLGFGYTISYWQFEMILNRYRK